MHVWAHFKGLRRRRPLIDLIDYPVASSRKLYQGLSIFLSKGIQHKYFNSDKTQDAQPAYLNSISRASLTSHESYFSVVNRPVNHINVLRNHSARRRPNMPPSIRNTSMYDETCGKADFAIICRGLCMESHSMLLSD